MAVAIGTDKVTDVYPSRVSSEPTIIERQDPVVYAKASDQASAAAYGLNPDQVESFRKDGFLFFENLFPEDEVDHLRDELAAMWKESESEDVPEVVREPTSQEIRSIFAVHEGSRLFGQLSRDHRILDKVTQLVGSDVYIHQSRINFKPGFEGQGFAWHSDFETWHTEDGMPRMRAVSCSIALTDNYPFNGSLMVVPGSHRHFVSCVGETPENHYQQSLRKQELGVPDRESLSWLMEKGGITMPTGPAGSVLFFECNLMHGSGDNITPFPRSNLFLVYNSVENTLVEPFAGTKPRPDFIASRKG